MSDPESEPQSSASVPEDVVLDKGLRDAVSQIFETGNTEQLTVKRVRSATEKALGLDDGFFRSHADWKGRSDEIIKNEAEKQEQLAEQREQLPSSRPAKQEQTQSQKPKFTKRSSAGKAEAPRKRRKKEPSPDALDEASESPQRDEGKGVTKADNEQSLTSSNIAKLHDSEDRVTEQSEKLEQDNAGSESELSVLVDEVQKPKHEGQQQKKAPSNQAKKSKATAKKRKEEPNIDSEQAEIKRLQGWLVKCGIRKMWSRELAPYDTPKAKIKHLKQMLKDAGMEGRYSREKANQIREERELRADLEGVQEGAKLWGTGARTRSEEKGKEEEQPRRRLARGLKNFDFLIGEDEETD